MKWNLKNEIEVPGMMSEQKAAWEETWNSAWHLYSTDGRWRCGQWGEAEERTLAKSGLPPASLV